jgi:hypothetical protein
MAQQSKVVTSLVGAANIAPTDCVMIIYNANNINSNASLRLLPMSTLSANITIQNITPANSSANGNPGNIAYDNNYIYVCTSNNIWYRSALSSF